MVLVVLTALVVIVLLVEVDRFEWMRRSGWCRPVLKRLETSWHLGCQCSEVTPPSVCL